MAKKKLKAKLDGLRLGKVAVTVEAKTPPIKDLGVIEVVDSDLATIAKFLETPINGHLPSLRYAPLVEKRPWTIFTPPGIQLCASSLGVLVTEMRRLLKE